MSHRNKDDHDESCGESTELLSLCPSHPNSSDDDAYDIHQVGAPPSAHSTDLPTRLSSDACVYGALSSDITSPSPSLSLSRTPSGGYFELDCVTPPPPSHPWHHHGHFSLASQSDDSSHGIICRELNGDEYDEHRGIRRSWGTEAARRRRQVRRRRRAVRWAMAAVAIFGVVILGIVAHRWRRWRRGREPMPTLLPAPDKRGR